MDLIELIKDVEQNKILTILILMAAGFIDALPIAGFFIHGTWLFAIAIYLLHRGSATIFFIMTCAFLGVYLGDQSSYAIGKIVNLGFFKFKISNKRMQTINKAKYKINKYGVFGVIIGRFITPLRSITPLTCALLQMPYKKFAWASFLSCTIWTFVWSIVLLIVDKGLMTINIFGFTNLH